VDLNDSADLEGAATSALTEGRIVRATGTFFFDDFGWICASLNNMPKLFELKDRQMRIAVEVQLGKLDRSGGTREHVEEEKRRLVAELETSSVKSKGCRSHFATEFRIVT
jgi:hypothetical protein